MVLATEDGADVRGQADVDYYVLRAGVVVDGDIAEKGKAVSGVDALGCAAENGVQVREGKC